MAQHLEPTGTVAGYVMVATVVQGSHQAPVSVSSSGWTLIRTTTQGSRDPARGVVDPTLRVHGFDNLHVCDASVFPTAITVNPQ